MLVDLQLEADVQVLPEAVLKVTVAPLAFVPSVAKVSRVLVPVALAQVGTVIALRVVLL